MRLILPVGLLLLASGPLTAGEQPAPTSTAAAAASSSAVAEAVTRALQSQAEIAEREISVTMHAGVVVLIGEVHSEAEAQAAVSAAEAVADGARVSSHLTLRPVAREAELAAFHQVRTVEQALRRDSRTAQLGVAVSIDEEGVIGLHGLVPSAEGRSLAEQVASRVEGVSRIRNHLVVPGED